MCVPVTDLVSFTNHSPIIKIILLVQVIFLYRTLRGVDKDSHLEGKRTESRTLDNDPEIGITEGREEGND